MCLLLLQRNADYRPNDIAVVFGERKLDYRQLLHHVEALARGLIESGIQPGDRIGLFLENSPEFLISFYGVAACCACNVPLNTDFKEDELRFYLDDAGVKCLFVDESRLDLAERVVAGLPQQVLIIVNGDTAHGGCLSLGDLLRNESGILLPSADFGDDVVHIYTSGSTGRPKCAPRTVLQYWWEMSNVIEGIHLTREDTIFCMIPMFHNYGAVHCMTASMGSGARLVILDKINPFVMWRNRALQVMEAEKVTVLPGVPFMFEHLGASTIDADLSSVRFCYSAAAALTPEIADAFFAKFGVPIRNHYGCTEVGAMTVNIDDDPRRHGDSVGQALPGVNVRILDDDGNDVPVGEVGEIVVGARQMTRGYLGQDEASREHFRDGFHFTGDLGCLDADGRLYLRARKKFVIDVVGQKVSPIEIEDVLDEHPAVTASVAIGVPNPHGHGEVVKAYAVLQKPVGRDELVRFCRDRLANFKVPQFIEFISKVPTGSLGKVMRQHDALEQLVLEPDSQ
jgi:long-chain acyl-CoA synthetase